MSAKPFQYSDFLVFSSAKPLPYGQSITIIEKPIRQNGHWVANVLLSSSEYEKIFLNTGDLKGERFIIVRSESKGNNYSHTAVLVEEINRESQKIESNITNLLKRI